MEKHIVEIQKKISPILFEYKIKKAGIFGSYARGDFKEKSDVDILIELNNNYGLLGIIELKMKLEKILKKKVDLIEYNTIKKQLKKNILKEEVRII